MIEKRKKSQFFLLSLLSPWKERKKNQNVLPESGGKGTERKISFHTPLSLPSFSCICCFPCLAAAAPALSSPPSLSPSPLPSLGVCMPPLPRCPHELVVRPHLPPSSPPQAQRGSTCLPTSLIMPICCPLPSSRSLAHKLVGASSLRRALPPMSSPSL